MTDLIETPDQNSLIVAKKEAALQTSFVMDSGDGHLMTIAPTGAGKGISSIVPNLLHYDGPAVVIDPKGEAYQITANHRRKMGQEVILLDPFNVTGDSENAGAFNPLDLIRTETQLGVDDAKVISDMLVHERYIKDPFWDNASKMMIQGFLMHVKHHAPPALKNLGEISYLANQSQKELEYTFKEMRQAKISFVSQMGAVGLGHHEKVLASITSVLQTHVECFNSRIVNNCLCKTSFELADFFLGKPQTIYIVLPPEKLKSHSALLRVWVGSLINLLSRRKASARQKTVFMIDEAAQLGFMDEILKMTTLMRGYGVRLWTFWQDLSQLKSIYPDDWKGLVNNCSTLQLFGFNNLMAAESCLNISGKFTKEDLLTLEEEHQVLIQAKKIPLLAEKVKYFEEPYLQKRAEKNRFYEDVLDKEDAKGMTSEVPKNKYANMSTMAQIVENLKKSDGLCGDADFEDFCKEVQRIIDVRIRLQKSKEKRRARREQKKKQGQSAKNETMRSPRDKVFSEAELEKILKDMKEINQQTTVS